MRKIEEMMINAVNEVRNWKSGNTEVQVINGQDNAYRARVFLHGNCIYEKVYVPATGFRCTAFTLAGWNTMTTRSRLRALGVDITGRIGRANKATYNGTEIESNQWYEVK